MAEELPSMDMYDRDRTDSFSRAFDHFTGTGDEKALMMGLQNPIIEEEADKDDESGPENNYDDDSGKDF
jgi:hypothetical protein